MGNFFAELGGQIKRIWEGLNTWQRGALIAVCVLVPLGLIWLVVSLQPNYEPLYTKVSETDRYLIEQRLTELAIPYQTNATDGTIQVLPKDRARARMLLAREGIPHASAEGYTLFDRQRLGATEFEQRLNYQRALEGELEEAIRTVEGVREARVHLVLPKPTVFTEREKQPTAAVLLTLKEANLQDKEIEGIVHLVAKSVEGLTPENITVSDSTGRTISRRYDAQSLLSEEQKAKLQQEEDSRVEKILSILWQAYGNKVDGRTITAVATAHCTAKVNEDIVQTESTQYQPDTVISKEHIVSEQATGTGGSAVGVAGVTSNILGLGANAGQGGDYSREESTTEYQASVTKETRRAAPKLESLSTAVLVNSQVLSALVGTPAYDQETQQIRNIINGAVGYDPNDTAGVIRAPQVEFLSFAPLGPPLTPPTARPWWQNPLWIMTGVLGLAALLLLLLLLKPRLAPRIVLEEPTPIEEEALPTQDDEVAGMLEEQRRQVEMEALERERRRRRRQELIDLADADPEAIEKVMRQWADS